MKQIILSSALSIVCLTGWSQNKINNNTNTFYFNQSNVSNTNMFQTSNVQSRGSRGNVNYSNNRNVSNDNVQQSNYMANNPVQNTNSVFQRNVNVPEVNRGANQANVSVSQNRSVNVDQQINAVEIENVKINEDNRDINLSNVVPSQIINVDQEISEIVLDNVNGNVEQTQVKVQTNEDVQQVVAFSAPEINLDINLPKPAITFDLKVKEVKVKSDNNKVDLVSTKSVAGKSKSKKNTFKSTKVNYHYNQNVKLSTKLKNAIAKFVPKNKKGNSKPSKTIVVCYTF